MGYTFWRIIVTGIIILNYKVAFAEPLNRIVAVINDEVITQKELDHRVDMVTKIQNYQTLPAKDELRKQVLKQFINEKLQLQVAKRTGITVSDEEVKDSLNALRNQQDWATFRAQLKQEGFTLAEFQQHLKNQLLVQKLFERDVGSQILITQEQVNKVLNSPDYNPIHRKEYHVYDLLISLSDEPSSDEVYTAHQKAIYLRNQLNQGKNFQQLAMAESEGENALTGGDLGWRRLSALPDTFAKAIKDKLAGEVVGPLRAPNGFHLLLLADLRQSGGHHYVNQVWLRHILLKPMAFDQPQDLQATLVKLKNKIQQGDNFASLAKLYSQDTFTASKGGDLGWIGPGILPTALELAVEQLKPGEVSDPIQTEGGWQLVQLVKRRKKEDTAAFEADRIRKMIYRQQLEQSRQAWLQQVRKASHIKVVE